MARESPRRRQNCGVEKEGFMDTYHHWENSWLMDVHSLKYDKNAGFDTSPFQWEFQDPKIEVLYRIRPFLGGISP